MEFSRQEYWSGLPFPPPENLPDAGIEPGSRALQADFLLSEQPEKPHLVVWNQAIYNKETASPFLSTVPLLQSFPALLAFL